MGSGSSLRDNAALDLLELMRIGKEGHSELDVLSNTWCVRTRRILKAFALRGSEPTSSFRCTHELSDDWLTWHRS